MKRVRGLESERDGENVMTKLKKNLIHVYNISYHDKNQKKKQLYFPNKRTCYDTLSSFELILKVSTYNTFLSIDE